MFKVLFTKQAGKDAVNIQRSKLKPQIEKIVTTVQTNPFEYSQSFEALKGRLSGKYSRRINKEHRFVYEVLPNTDKIADSNGNIFECIVKVLSMWTHYENVQPLTYDK